MLLIKLETKEPLYTHDCRGCHYLGTYVEIDEGVAKNESIDRDCKWRAADLYFCDKSHHGYVEFIARWSSDGPFYSSTSMFNGKKVLFASVACLKAQELYLEWLANCKRLEDSNLDWVAQKEGRPW